MVRETKEKTKGKVRERFAHEEYPIHIIGRHIDLTDAIKSYAVDKMTAKLKRYGARVVEATIVIDVQWIINSVDFIINVNNVKIKVSGKTDNMYSAIDQAVDHLEARLTKYIRKIHEHKAPSLPEIEMKVNVIQRADPLEEINDQIEEETLKKVEETFKPHAVAKVDKITLKTLTQDEAIMKMELSNDSFLIYIGEEDRKVKVIHRRSDGNYGIIDTQ